eukprot:scaffold71946_cov58-Attheya_sp.AAC.1
MVAGTINLYRAVRTGTRVASLLFSPPNHEWTPGEQRHLGDIIVGYCRSVPVSSQRQQPRRIEASSAHNKQQHDGN